MASDGTTYYLIKAKPEAALDDIKRFQTYIDLMADTSAVALELAATYDAFREMESHHDKALERLRRKKASKCQGTTVDDALALVGTLGVPSN